MQHHATSPSALTHAPPDGQTALDQRAAPPSLQAAGSAAGDEPPLSAASAASACWRPNLAASGTAGAGSNRSAGGSRAASCPLQSGAGQQGYWLAGCLPVCAPACLAGWLACARPTGGCGLGGHPHAAPVVAILDLGTGVGWSGVGGRWWWWWFVRLWVGWGGARGAHKTATCSASPASKQQAECHPTAPLPRSPPREGVPAAAALDGAATAWAFVVCRRSFWSGRQAAASYGAAPRPAAGHHSRRVLWAGPRPVCLAAPSPCPPCAPAPGSRTACTSSPAASRAACRQRGRRRQAGEHAGSGAGNECGAQGGGEGAGGWGGRALGGGAHARSRSPSEMLCLAGGAATHHAVTTP